MPLKTDSSKLDIRFFGAIGDGQSHLLSSKFATLADAQAVYPFATSLSNELDRCAIQKALNSSPKSMVFLPKGEYLIDDSLQIPKDIKMSGIGGAFQTRLIQNNDVPILKLDQKLGSTERFWLKGLTLIGKYDVPCSSPIMDLNHFFICYFDDIYIWNGYKGIRIYGNDDTSALFFNNCIFHYLRDYAVKNEGQYSIHFNNCDFERFAEGSTNFGSKVIVDNSLPGNRKFNKTTFANCHFELSTIEINAEGVSIENSHIYKTDIILKEQSQHCRLKNNSIVSEGSCIIDLGFNNEIEGIFYNTLETGITPYKISSNVIPSNDKVFKGLPGDEFLFITHKIPFSTDFIGTIKYQDAQGSVLYESEPLTLLLDSKDVGKNATKIGKPCFTNMFCGRINNSGGIKIINSDINKVKINLLKNGTFYNNTANLWSVVPNTTIEANASSLYTTIHNTAGGSFGIYQDIFVKSGSRYLIAAQVKNDTLGKYITLGNAWDGSTGAVRARAGEYILPQQDKICFLYFQAHHDYSQRISIGHYSGLPINIRWIALIDLDDQNKYSNEIPTINIEGFVYKLHKTTGESLSWINVNGSWHNFGIVG